VPVKCPEYPVLRVFCGREEELSRLNPAEPGGVWRVMSPTSYQTAPPRDTDNTRLVALVQHMLDEPTVLLPCVEPKSVPVIVTSSAISPQLGDKLLMAGEAEVVEDPTL
jgi:hypothetical protein